VSDDRRKFIRYDIPLDLEFKTFDNSSGYSSGITTNFSRSGLCFISSDDTPKLREVIDLKLKLPMSDHYTSAVGDIVWKEALENKCLYGVKLMVMDAEAKGVILDTAYNRWLDTMRS